ncbi:hypothetical protein [Neobacillus sp. PS2-9]|uniref:hypothetical protein n=1 Tax=Neobacillus sp. PS2-9 TaxID=3070676 RepID=UPI0027DF2E34|nr:hypothetical protein [Neobacillus sp. PS2-9]WML57453.1 hypothetical protein RCG25_21505 [Neobacillus sp. PS2-9]
MRKKINIQMESEMNPVADIWFQHLIQRIIVEQLDVPHRLQAKLLYQDIVKERSNNGSNNKK